jgi:anti-sigma B factor antagonist
VDDLCWLEQQGRSCSCWGFPIVAISDELVGGIESPEGQVGDVQVFFDPDVTLIMLSGEVDLALGPELEDAGRDAIDRGVPIHVDLTRVTFLDSVGIGFIARVAAAGHAAGQRATVVGASRRIREGIALSGLQSLLDQDL